MTREIARDLSRRELLVGAGSLGSTVLAGCVENVRSDPGDRGRVIVKGSSTVFLISDIMAQEFMAETENEVNVTVDSTGTGGGFKNYFCPDRSDINGASRPITEEELNNCQSNGVEPVEFQVGKDALTVAVNNDADWVDCMTFSELSRIWREDGADRWSDIREEWPDEPIKLFGPAPTSGTYDWFNENVIGEDYRHTTEHEQTEKDNIIIQGIDNDRYAMGYLGYAYYSENSGRVKAVNVETEESDGCVEPTLENAIDGSYPMTRPLFIYVNRESLDRPAVFDYVTFYLKNAATDIVSEVGYVPASEQLRDDNLLKLMRNKP